MGELCPWVTGTGPDKPGLVSQVCGPKHRNKAGQTVRQAQGLELGRSMICALFLGVRVGSSVGQVESTGVGPLLCDKEILDSEVLMARV